MLSHGVSPSIHLMLNRVVIVSLCVRLFMAFLRIYEILSFVIAVIFLLEDSECEYLLLFIFIIIIDGTSFIFCSLVDFCISKCRNTPNKSYYLTDHKLIDPYELIDIDSCNTFHEKIQFIIYIAFSVSFFVKIGNGDFLICDNSTFDAILHGWIARTASCTFRLLISIYLRLYLRKQLHETLKQNRNHCCELLLSTKAYANKQLQFDSSTPSNVLSDNSSSELFVSFLATFFIPTAIGSLQGRIKLNLDFFDHILHLLECYDLNERYIYSPCSSRNGCCYFSYLDGWTN